jgi:site-specific recombinase XerD
MAEPPAPSVPLAEAVTEFLQWLELDRHASLTTVAAYSGELSRFQAFCERSGSGSREVATIDRDLLRAFQRAIARATRAAGTGRQRLAPATRRRRLIALRTFLRFCRREEWIDQDLASGIDLPRLPERLPKPLEDTARERLVASLTASSLAEKRDRALLLLLLSTGARISELLRLDRTDWARDRLVLRGKGDRERPALVTQRARRAVDTYLRARDDRSPALFISLQPASRGRPDNRLTAQGARHICHQLAQDAGVAPFHPHQLRHTLGTLLQERLGDARLTAETLGHTGLASVSGYTKITERRRGEARRALEEGGL